LGAKQNNTLDDPVRAVRIKVDAEYAEMVEPLLASSYSSSSITYPDGIKLRLVPEYSSLLNMEMRTKVKQLLYRQEAFAKTF